MAILRKPKIREFTQIDNAVLQNERLSWKARGILGYLLSKPEGWEVRISDLLAASRKDGKDSLRNGLKELEFEGFLEWTQARGAGGKFESVLDIYEQPLPEEMRGQNVRGSIKFITEEKPAGSGKSALEEANSAEINDFMAENPPKAENPQPPKSENSGEMPANIEENANINETAKAENPPKNKKGGETEETPLRFNRGGKPASVNNNVLSNTDLEILVSSTEETFVGRLSAEAEKLLRKSICEINYQGAKKVSPITNQEWQSIKNIFVFWVGHFKFNKNTKLTPERGRAVLDRLRSPVAWTETEICEGIVGNSKSPHHNGLNERGEKYHDLELICRTDQKLANAFGFNENQEGNQTYDQSNRNQTGGGTIRTTRQNQTLSTGGSSNSGTNGEDALQRIGARTK